MPGEVMMSPQLYKLNEIIALGHPAVVGIEPQVFILCFSGWRSIRAKGRLSGIGFNWFDLFIDDHGSFVIYRATSVRPKHLSDQDFDHDYYFKLSFRGSEMANLVDDDLFHAMDINGLPECDTNSAAG
jgi:hypothetical protein